LDIEKRPPVAGFEVDVITTVAAGGDMVQITRRFQAKSRCRRVKSSSRWASDKTPSVSAAGAGQALLMGISAAD